MKFTVGTKLTLAFGAVLVASVVSTALLLLSMVSLQRNLDEVAERSEPRSAAAFEMEINTVGSGLGVLKYVLTGRRDALARVEDDRVDFARWSRRYARLADDKHRPLARQSVRRFRAFSALGDRLIAERDELELVVGRAAATVPAAEDALDFYMSRGEPAQRVHFRRLGADLDRAAMIVTSSLYPRSRKEIERKSQALVRLARTAREMQEQGGALRRPGVQLSRAVVDLRGAARSRAVIAGGIDRFVVQRRALDHLLDERVQRLAVQELAAEKRSAADRVATTLRLLAGLALLVALITLALWTATRRAVLGPLARLDSAMAHVARGELHERVPVAGRDELSRLSAAFNAMAERLQATLVSRGRLAKSETQLRATVGELQQEIGARTTAETALRDERQRLAHQAAHDPLTQLPNRREFEHRLGQAIDRARNDGVQSVLCYLDLDQFKMVNDSCGHAAGDQLLQELGGELRRLMRGSDTLARVGGDEFAALFEGCSLDRGSELADRLREAVERFDFEYHGERFDVRVSAGAVIVNGDSELEELLKAADAACYAAKDAGRNRVQVYLADDTELARRQGEAHWVTRINKALHDDRFVLYEQLIVSISDPDAQGVHRELLLRMVGDDGRPISPGEFLPAAERYGLMCNVDEWVIREALRILSDTDIMSGDLFAINLSGISLQQLEFLDTVKAVLTASEVPGSAICFEITETAMIARLGNAVRFITEMRQLGCRFALDDFGSGLSPFAHLRTLPVDFLKIDGSLVRGLAAGDEADTALVEGLNELAQRVGLQTVAEFVESERVIELLRDIGVDFVQGYAVSHPEPFGGPTTVDALGRAPF